MPTALGEAGAPKATAAIARQMQTLLAADVIYETVTRPEINGNARRQRDRRLRRAEEHLPPRRHQMARRSRSDRGAGGGQRLERRHRQPRRPRPRPGRGQIGETELVEEAANSVVVEGTPEVEVEVQNQGESTENGVTVVVTANGNETTQEIATLEPGAAETAVVPLTPAPKGETTLEVEAEPVPGEQFTEQQRSDLHRQLRIAWTGCGSPIWDRRGPSPRTRWAKRSATPSSSRCGPTTVFDAILAVIEGRADRALAPYENSIEGSVRGTLDILAFDAPNVGDRRRARLPGAPAPDHPRGRRARPDRGGALPPAGAGADGAVPAREPARGRTAQRQQHRGGGADGLRVAAALGGGRLARGGGPLRLPDPARGDPGRGRTT